MTSTESVTQAGLGKSFEDSTKKRSLSIWYWAIPGIGFTFLQCWVFWQWFASGDMKAVQNPGPSQAPEWMQTALNVNDIVWAIAAVLMLVFFVIKPWVKNRGITVEAIVTLAFIFLWWQDPLVNYIIAGSSYNLNAFNLGSWGCHIPTFESPGGCLMAQPIFSNFALYFVVFPLAVILGSRYLRKSKLHRPDVRTDINIFKLFAALFILDMAFELSMIGIGLYHYGGANEVVSIFDNTRFKFPLYRPFFLALTLTAFSIALYFEGDDGDTCVTRGSSSFRSGGIKSLMKFFAYVGAINIMFIYAVQHPINLFMISTDAWPTEIQKRSYFTNGICGSGTRYICAGRDGGRPKNDALAINVGPNGEIVIPEGATIPTTPQTKTSLSGKTESEYDCRKYPIFNKMWPCGGQERWE